MRAYPRLLPCLLFLSIPPTEISPRPEGLPAASINKLQLLRLSLPPFSSPPFPTRLPYSLSFSFRGMAPAENVLGESGGGKRYFPDNILTLSLLLSAPG